MWKRQKKMLWMTARDEELNTKTIMRVGERADSKWDKRINNRRRMFAGVGLSEDLYFSTVVVGKAGLTAAACSFNESVCGGVRVSLKPYWRATSFHHSSPHTHSPKHTLWRANNLCNLPIIQFPWLYFICADLKARGIIEAMLGGCALILPSACKQMFLHKLEHVTAVTAMGKTSQEQNG